MGKAARPFHAEAVLQKRARFTNRILAGSNKTVCVAVHCASHGQWHEPPKFVAFSSVTDFWKARCGHPLLNEGSVVEVLPTAFWMRGNFNYVRHRGYSPKEGSNGNEVLVRLRGDVVLLIL